MVHVNYMGSYGIWHIGPMLVLEESMGERVGFANMLSSSRVTHSSYFGVEGVAVS